MGRPTFVKLVNLFVITVVVCSVVTAVTAFEAPIGHQNANQPAWRRAGNHKHHKRNSPKSVAKQELVKSSVLYDTQYGRTYPPTAHGVPNPKYNPDAPRSIHSIQNLYNPLKAIDRRQAVVTEDPTCDDTTKTPAGFDGSCTADKPCPNGGFFNQSISMNLIVLILFHHDL